MARQLLYKMRCVKNVNAGLLTNISVDSQIKMETYLGVKSACSVRGINEIKKR